MKIYFVGVFIGLFACCQNNTAVDNNSTVKDSIVSNIEQQENTLKYSKTDAQKNLPEGIKQELPSDCNVIKNAEGDLNQDSLNDFIVVTQRKKFAVGDTSENAKRSVIIFIAQRDGTYKLNLKNDNIIYFIDKLGNDPLNDIVIKNGYFSFEQSGNAGALNWSRIITFKYSSKSLDWNLHKDGGEIYHPVNGDLENQSEKINKSSKDFGQIQFDQFNVYVDEWTGYLIDNME